MSNKEKFKKLRKAQAEKPVNLPSNVSFLVDEIVWDGEGANRKPVLRVKVKNNRTYDIPIHWLEQKEVQKISDNRRYFLADLCDIRVTLLQTKEGFTPKATIDIEYNDATDLGPVSLVDYDDVPLEMLPYNINGTTYHVRREGYSLLVAPTGGGKTYNAINNINMLSTYFDEILYLNYELSKNDIVSRARQMKVDLTKVKSWDNTNIKALLKYAEGKSIAFIVDNIDNLVGLTSDTYMSQVRFIQDLDRFLKNTNNHALILTQFVKDSTIELFNKDGTFSNQINQNIVSGAKQISNNARSGIFAAYNPIESHYDSTWIKKGEGKTDIDSIREYMEGK